MEWHKGFERCSVVFLQQKPRWHGRGVHESVPPIGVKETFALTAPLFTWGFFKQPRLINENKAPGWLGYIGDERLPSGKSIREIPHAQLKKGPCLLRLYGGWNTNYPVIYGDYFINQGSILHSGKMLAMENGLFGDVFPIENGDFPLLC